MPSFRWLHLTDLHLGLRGQHTLFPAVKAALRQDLLRVRQALGGPLDLVLFTGDLSQRGDPAELAGLGPLLHELLDPLGPKGPPPFLAVPGNHDLQRPVSTMASRAFLGADEADGAFAEDWRAFWSQPNHEWRRVVIEAFKAYTQWWEGLGLPRPAKFAPGLLPGEWFATMEKEGLAIGIAGLNTAARQIADGDFEGRLLADPAQLHAAPRGDGVAWAAAHGLNFLLSHHPPHWLSPPSRAAFEGEVMPYFDLHLCGHLHEGLGAVGGWMGQPRRWQAPSLFGLEQTGGHAVRAHGYTAGLISWAGSSASLRLWPRVGVAPRGGLPWRITPDVAGGLPLEADGGSLPVPLALRAAAPPAPPRAPVEPPRPGPAMLEWTLRQLVERGAAVIYGPTGFGKTQLGEAVLAEGAARHGWRTGRLDLSHFPTLTHLHQPEPFFRRMGRLLAEVDGVGLHEVWNQRWKEDLADLGPVDVLSSFIDRELAEACGGRPLVVSVEHVELLEPGLRGMLLAALRAQLERHRRVLHVLVGSSWPSWAWDSLPGGSPFNITLARELPGLTLPEVADLAGRLGVSADEVALKALREALDGHPALVHALLTEAAGQGLPPLIEARAVGAWLAGVERTAERQGLGEALHALSIAEGMVALPEPQLLGLYALGLCRLWVVRGRTQGSLAFPLLRQLRQGRGA